VWSYDQAEQVARGLQEAGVYWLEEPFEVGDRINSARLTRAMDMLITGGEHDLGVEPFAEYLTDDVFDIIQPDGFWSGGILTIKKIGSLAAALGKPCILHGCQSLTTFGWLQANAALTNCEYQELGLIRPRILPHEQWEPGIRLLNTPYMFQMDKEYITIPQGPGLGMDVNEDALEEYRQRS
jgi:D-galactarolactone cycloisomerase